MGTPVLDQICRAKSAYGCARCNGAHFTRSKGSAFVGRVHDQQRQPVREDMGGRLRARLAVSRGALGAHNCFVGRRFFSYCWFMFNVLIGMLGDPVLVSYTLAKSIVSALIAPHPYPCDLDALVHILHTRAWEFVTFGLGFGSGYRYYIDRAQAVASAFTTAS